MSRRAEADCGGERRREARRCRRRPVKRAASAMVRRKFAHSGRTHLDVSTTLPDDDLAELK